MSYDYPETMRDMQWWEDYYRFHEIPRPELDIAFGPQDAELISTIIYNHEKQTVEIIPEKGPMRNNLQSKLVLLLKEISKQKRGK